jgi:hypothetical protein
MHIAPPPQGQLRKTPQKTQEQVAYVTAENLRELRGLIRYRYALDCEIWSGRKLKWYQRDTVETKMAQADAALEAIHKTLDGWDRPEYFATSEEYNRFREIKRRVVDAETRDWKTNPPWAPEHSRGVHEKDGRQVHVNVQHVYH